MLRFCGILVDGNFDQSRSLRLQNHVTVLDLHHAVPLVCCQPETVHLMDVFRLKRSQFYAEGLEPFRSRQTSKLSMSRKTIVALTAFLGALLVTSTSLVASAAEPAAVPSPPTASPDYIIGPGDTLEVFVWRNPELSTRVPVRPDGKISTPLVEDLTAVGKTTSGLARDIELVLGKYVRTPQVNVIVSTALSAMSKVTVVGAAARPGSIPYRDGLRVMDAVLAVGGMSEFAAGNRAKIVRTDGPKNVEIRIRLKDLLEKGELKENELLKPGDVLVIPESFF